VLFAFGGNGPVHAVELARALGLVRVLVPVAPGLFSAFGLLFADVEHHYVRTCFRRTDDLDPADLVGLFAGLEQTAVQALAAEGFPSHEHVLMRRQVDMRYAGQSFELTVPLADGPLDRAAIDALREAFGQEHLRTYGHRGAADQPVDLVNVRLIATGRSEHPRIPDDEHLRQFGRTPRRTAGPDSRQAYFGASTGRVLTPVLDRATLGASPQPGPFIVEEYDATTIVPPNCSASLDAWGDIVIDIQDSV
jgi:N-methylhydantoinase A